MLDDLSLYGDGPREAAAQVNFRFELHYLSQILIRMMMSSELHKSR